MEKLQRSGHPDQFQHEEVRALILIETTDGGDVGVVQRGPCLGLPFEAREAGGTLIATSRPSLLSVARYTSPIPPSPSLAVIR